ncbi:hypothetical protein BC939DRAFT_451486 [Gamsiella multidivaricata]|uniref:uncharacterized protein n=1 Tax=Gamsiella multidivaricata TaxID=101098 RepID=UPI002220BC80|nr:uncharacterized protein BC939DRAFT_451486 [Gamsiella multidivaricata]KAI7823604.1 hypothetical protein BC939DRAFT_451486 [Gamsiella multidivaricata]
MNVCVYGGRSARLIRHFTMLQNYIAPAAWGLILVIGVFHDRERYLKQTPLVEGQSPPFFSDAAVFLLLMCSLLAYLATSFWFFVRTGVLDRDYKRDYSYEELYENEESFTYADANSEGRTSRFAV